MTSNNERFINQLLEDRSFQSWVMNANKIDVDFWNNWILENPGKLESIEIAKSIVLGVEFKKNSIPASKINAEFDKVMAKLNPKPVKEPKLFSLKKYYKYAVAAILIFGAFIGTFQILDQQNTVTHTTRYGEILDLQLPDGTSVVLNGNSEISYTKDNSRAIHLIGEAYFKVKPIPATRAKFWVNTNDLQVEVFGTKFHVNTRKKSTKVVLDEGSVHLKLNNGQEKEMVPGDMVTYSKEKDKISLNSVSKKTAYSLWRDGTYTFNNITLKEVMKNLEFTYGLEAKFEDTGLEQLKLTGGIPNENLMICITAIEKVTGTSIHKTENQLLIKKNLN